MTNATMTELPVMSIPPMHRSSTLDNGLWNGALDNDNHNWTDATPEGLDSLGYSSSARGLSIWNEAHNENNRRAPIEEMPTREVELERQIVQQAEMIASLRSTIDTLSNEQISGDDYRLTDFWQAAQEAADNAGHCSVFDDLSESLGGPRRIKTFAVEVDVVVRVMMYSEGRDEESALAEARGSLDEYRIREAVDEGNWEARWDDADMEESD